MRLSLEQKKKQNASSWFWHQRNWPPRTILRWWLRFGLRNVFQVNVFLYCLMYSWMNAVRNVLNVTPHWAMPLLSLQIKIQRNLETKDDTKTVKMAKLAMLAPFSVQPSLVWSLTLYFSHDRPAPTTLGFSRAKDTLTRSVARMFCVLLRIQLETVKEKIND